MKHNSEALEYALIAGLVVVAMIALLAAVISKASLQPKPFQYTTSVRPEEDGPEVATTAPATLPTTAPSTRPL